MIKVDISMYLQYMVKWISGEDTNVSQGGIPDIYVATLPHEKVMVPPPCVSTAHSDCLPKSTVEKGENKGWETPPTPSQSDDQSCCSLNMLCCLNSWRALNPRGYGEILRSLPCALIRSFSQKVVIISPSQAHQLFLHFLAHQVILLYSSSIAILRPHQLAKPMRTTGSWTVNLQNREPK